MKKTNLLTMSAAPAALAVSLVLISGLLLFAACSGSPGDGPDGSGNNGGGAGNLEENGTVDGQGATEAFKGATSDILQQVMEEAKSKLEEYELPETFMDPITAENAPGMLGLTSDDFVSFVEEATSTTDMLDTRAFQVSVIKCREVHDAELVDGMIRAGFDSGKWVYAFPEKSLTVVSGSYILLAVGSIQATDTLAETFMEAAGGNAKDPNIFYSGETGGDGGGSGFVAQAHILS